MNEKYLQPYNAQKIEDAIYKTWEESGYFNPDEMIAAGLTSATAEPFSIVLPPPNVTGQLHLGHAFEDSAQDAIIRFNRMLGKKTLWVPGTDHAAIATQSKFEKELYKKEKKSRHDYTRDEFFNMTQEFGLNHQTTIIGQLKKMGSSLDWTRLCFTLDEKRQHAVFQAFKKMHETGLIYQKDRIVNWDVKGQTTVSDDEVVREERTAIMYTFKYSADFPFPIATTRPETKLGDTAVAVHPDDPRYQQYIGKEYSFEFAGESVSVKIVADEYVDPEFGVGALGVTPAHSIADWEISERHGLASKQVINEYGKMMLGNDLIKNTKAADARQLVAQWLRDEGLMIDEEPIKQNVGVAERTGGIIEPLPKLQWWINVNKKFKYPHASLDGIKKNQEVSLKELMLHAVESGQSKIIPERFDKIYRHWISNLRDWNISRQIIYGHRVPVWYKGNPNQQEESSLELKDRELKISETSPGEGWQQDSDTLDTWFSSGLWSFSTLGWPDTDSDDFKNYHPTNILNPGYEILPLWVSRMVLMSTFLVGDVPFKEVYIHGMLRDKQGRKFSKSLNNGIDPLEVIAQYGTDALRMALTIGVTPGQDMSFDLQKVKAYSKFANKIWNITRFVLTETESINTTQSISYAPRDSELLAEQKLFLAEITREMKENKLYLVAEKLYHYAWHTFADEIIEESKTIFENGTEVEKTSRQYFLLHTLKFIITTLHPFMPFITEEIWKDLKGENDRDILMTALWPK